MELFRLPGKGVTVYGCPLPSGASRADERAAVEGLLLEAFPARGGFPALGHDASGAPFVPGRAESISVAHCGGLAALGVCCGGHGIGIDAETSCRGDQLRRVAGKFLSDGQRTRWGGSEALLLRGWTIKEALYKAAGIAGLPLHDITLPMEEALSWGEVGCEVELRGRAFMLYDIEIPWFDGDITLAVEKIGL